MKGHAQASRIAAAPKRSPPAHRFIADIFRTDFLLGL